MFTQDGYGPPPPPQKTRKHVFPVAGWSGVASLAPGRPPSKAAGRRAACCYWSRELARQPPVSSSCPSATGGEEAPGLWALAEPPVTTREQWPGWASGWVEGQPLCSLLPSVKGASCWEACPPLTSPTLSCFPPCWAHCLPLWGQGKQRLQEISQAVAGVL